MLSKTVNGNSHLNRNIYILVITIPYYRNSHRYVNTESVVVEQR